MTIICNGLGQDVASYDVRVSCGATYVTTTYVGQTCIMTTHSVALTTITRYASCATRMATTMGVNAIPTICGIYTIAPFNSATRRQDMCVFFTSFTTYSASVLGCNVLTSDSRGSTTREDGVICSVSITIGCAIGLVSIETCQNPIIVITRISVVNRFGMGANDYRGLNVCMV